MKLVILTIVRDGMPWITLHYPELLKLTIPWEWHIVEGTSSPEHCTKWCRPLTPSLSTDGTTQYLNSLLFDTRIFLYRSEIWHGKLQMVNAPLRHLHEPCVLLQADSDELWTTKQLETIHALLSAGNHDCCHFYCRYFLGPDIIITSRNGFGNRTDFEWFRAWAYRPGMRFISHEPPKFDRVPERIMTHHQTAKHDLVFNHYAYATEAQVAFKQEFYGGPNNKLGPLYSDAVEGWRRLQANTRWPAKVGDYLRFVKDDSICERLT